MATKLGMYAVVVCACLSIVCSTHAATITVSATAPTQDGADIAQLASSNDPGGNQGHVWSNRPLHGQTFTTGPNPSGYMLNAVSLKNLNFSASI